MSTRLNQPSTRPVLNGATGFRKLPSTLFAILSLLILTAAFTLSASAQVVITPNYTQGWSTADTRPGGATTFIADGSAPQGAGSLRLTTDGTNAAKAQYMRTAPNVPLTGTLQLSYWTKQAAGPAHADPSYQLIACLSGIGANPQTPADPCGGPGFTTLVFEPYQNNGTSPPSPAIIPNSWQQWDVDAGQFWSSRTYTDGTCSVGAGAGGAPFYSLGGLQAACPNAKIVGFGVNIGSFNPGYDVQADALDFNGTVYNFEPLVSSISVTSVGAGTPTALDNDYTRVNNAVHSIASGGTITLNGTFNWTEPNAAASWALGSDGVTGTDDDYTVDVPANLNGVTFTAPSLGAATIQGPGDIQTYGFEGVLLFYNNGDNQNWTISNMRFLDFDWTIQMFFRGGGTDSFNGTQIINNYIRMPQDLAVATDSGERDFQNCGIHYSFGINQSISGNTIEIPGTSVSDPANNKNATNIGMQSNTSGGAVYNGLQITNNTINVTGAQGSAPEVILGIWENAHGHTSNITVSGNSFNNLNAGNNPLNNVQRGFRITSHSSATTTVAYNNNTVNGANIGFQWISGSNFSAEQPVQMKGNAILNGATGVLVQSNGSAAMSFNRIVGNSVAGVNNATAGTVNAENNWWGCNYGPGLGGAGCSGSANGVIGAIDADPWLVLTTSASPTSTGVGGTSAITSRLTTNSANATPAGGSVPSTPASFAGTNGSVAPSSANTSGGVTGTTFTATANGAGNVATTIDGQVVNAAININQPCVAISVPSSTTLRNVPVTVPVNTGDITGRGVVSYDFTVTYNPAVLSYTGVSKTGTASDTPSMVNTVNSSTPGTLIISGFSNTALTGSGPLLNLNFTSIGAIGTSSAVTVTAFSYNEDNPCTTIGSAGTVTIISGTISGQVTYLNNSTLTPVPGTVLTANGAIVVTDTTDANGLYDLSGLGNSTYTVVPSKTGDLINPVGNPAITGQDATRIAQHVVNISPFTPGGGAFKSADVSGNGTITSFDASMVARFVVNLPDTGNTGSWRFEPVSRSYTLVQVQTGMNAQDYKAILMGDVTGNWSDTTPSPTRQTVREEDLIRIDAPKMTVESGSEFVIPVQIGNLNRKDITSYQFELAFSSKAIHPATNPCDLLGTVSKDLFVTCNADTAGLLKVVVFGIKSVDGNGTLLNLRFTTVGSAGSITPLTFKTLMLNEGEPLIRAADGEIQIVEPSNDTDSLRGQVLSATGEAIAGTQVQIAASNGKTRTVYTNDSGYFNFDKVVVGETYVISVISKGHKFTPQTVSAGEGVTQLTLIAEQ